MTRLLLIHTAGAEGTVALAEDARVVASAVLPGRSSSERLVPEVRGLLEGAGWKLAELAAIVVVSGPGSFTGVRVGVSAAKGLSEAGGVPLIAVSRLALLAAAGGTTGLVHALLDAGRGEFYCGVYDGGVCLGEALLTGAEAVAAAGGGRMIACEDKVAESLGNLVQGQLQMFAEPLAGDLLPIALDRLARGAVDDALVLDANYLRRTDFEIKARLESRAAAGSRAE
jgi:tRNA threonylcarbamoyladenosine biosynthesis protein TsaB